MARKMPIQKPGKSETIVRTPPEFVQAVRNYLDITDFALDLAALKNNAVTKCYLGPDVDSLSQDWLGWLQEGVFKLFRDRIRRIKEAWCWLNPPYDHIEPWVRKAWEQEQRGVNTAVLVPASIGAKWWRRWVHKKAHVLIVGRLNFLDKHGDPIVSPTTGKPTPYPKDLALLLYGKFPNPDYEYFTDWKEWL